jgi:hypothetical protein
VVSTATLRAATAALFFGSRERETLTTREPKITWRRTFPKCKPGTDGVALADGRVIGRVRLMSELPASPKLWMWSVTDPDLGESLVGRPHSPAKFRRARKRWQPCWPAGER